MSLDRKAIVAGLIDIMGVERVITDESVLRENSHDRFRKYESIFGVYTLPMPAAVVRPVDTQQVSAVLQFLDAHGVNCVPRTGGSATEGGLETVVADSVVLDGSEMNRIVEVDDYNMLATAQCGVNLEVLESRVRQMGLTTGHSPQSKPLAQIGGLVATRSIGQLSTLYGGIEDMVVGLEAVFPNGTVTRIKNVPRRACGPDIRHVVIGSEGALCFITEVTVKLFMHRPANNLFCGYAVPNMETGLAVLREVIVQGYRPSVARLYDAADGAQHGFDQLAAGQCVLLFMTEGPLELSQATAAAIDRIASSHGDCKPVDKGFIENWFANLNWDQERVEREREYIREHRNQGFTTEVSGNWRVVGTIYENAIRRIQQEFPHARDLTLLGAHSSHSYQTGTNLYFVYDYNVVDCRPEDEIDKYHRPINAIIVEEALRAGGSMVHHHGIGKHRTQWTEEEHGTAYYVLKKLKEAFDPNDVMNVGTIYPRVGKEPRTFGDVGGVAECD